MSSHTIEISRRTAFLTAVTMIAFAANSILCRLALNEPHIDPSSYTVVRTLSGALMLYIILLMRSGRIRPFSASWPGTAALFVYIEFLSFAYVSLETGAGALILFGAVQLSMFAFALWYGERLSPISWFGLVLAILGLVFLLSPGLTAPDFTGAILMAISGAAWGVYSLIGRGAGNPLEATASNFIYTAPLVLLTGVIFLADFNMSLYGAFLAALSGAIASGCGYAIWYAALAGLTSSQAAIVQLSVPVIAAFSGTLFLSEAVTWRLLIASAMTLGGVAIVLSERWHKRGR